MNTCRSCRLSRSLGVLSRRIGLASAIRAPIFRVRGRLLNLLLCLLAGLCKLEAALNSVSRSAAEGTNETRRWSSCLRASRALQQWQRQQWQQQLPHNHRVEVMVYQYDKLLGYGCWMTSIPTIFHTFIFLGYSEFPRWLPWQPIQILQYPKIIQQNIPI